MRILYWTDLEQTLRNHFRLAPLLGILTKVTYQGGVLWGRIPFSFSWKLWNRKGQEIQCVNTVFSHSRSSSSALHCCLTSKREVVSRKSDSKPLPVLQIKTITLTGLIRSPLQPGEIRLFQLGLLPLIKDFQQNPQQKGYHKMSLSFEKVSAAKTSFSSRKVSYIHSMEWNGRFPFHSNCLFCSMSP